MKTKQWLIVPTLLVIGIVILSYFVYNQTVTSTTLSKKDIETRVAALYGGDVQTIVKNDSTYNVTFAVDDYMYEVVVNEDYGLFEQLTIIQEGTELPTQEEPLAPSVEELLTEQQVIAIAKKQARGTVDDVDFYTTNSGGYYIVEMESDDGDDVTLQIHAITGKILSVSFDD